MAVRPSDLFSTDEPVELVNQFEKYKASLNKAFGRPIPAGNADSARVHKALASHLEKGVSSDVVESVRESLAGPSLMKDLDIAGPGSTGGLHQYDLEAPSKNLVPRQTPLRNRISRRAGIGTAHEFKRITGFTGSGTGGVADSHPAMGETDTNQFGTLNLRRGKIIEYAGDHLTVPFRFFSKSDRATWQGSFASQGFEDLRQLSTTSTLYSSMLLEEKMLIGDRGTAAGFSGALGVPGAPTVTTPAATGSQAAVTGVSSANVYVAVSATTLWGETAASTVGTSAFTSGDVITVSWTHVTGATGYRIYVGQGASAPASTAVFYQAATPANTITLQGAIATSGSTVAAPVQTSATAHDSYDGILAYVLDPAKTGSLNYLNGPLTSDQPFQDAFSNMFDQNAADPQTIICNGHDRSNLSNVLKANESSNYRITLTNGSDGTVGQLVTAVQNQVTGNMVDLEVNRFCPQGVMPILSWNLPIPDSQISECWAVVNVQDYMAVSWPIIEFTYDNSVYWQGTFVSYASAFSGAVAGITKS